MSAERGGGAARSGDLERARAQEAPDGADGPHVHMSDVEFGGGDDTNFDLADKEDASSMSSDRSSFSLGSVNDLEKELYGDDVAAAKEAPHLAKLAKTARSSAHNGQP